MRILKGAITSLAEDGYIGVQIPQYDLWIDKDPPIPPADEKRYEDIPDEWVVLLKHSIPVVGKEKGLLFLTEKGWEANKDAIEKAFESAGRNKRGSWKDFTVTVTSHFQMVKGSTAKRIKLTEKKLKQLKEEYKKL